MKNLPVTQKLLAERREEIFAYLRFLRAALSRDASISYSGQRRAFDFSVKKELTHTLKANTYLLLYSVVEAILTQSMQEIHAAIGGSGVELDDLHPKLFLQVLRRFKASSTDASDSNLFQPCGRSIVEFWINDYKKRDKDNKNYLFSGNIDGQVICDIGLNYGFASGDKAQDAHLRHKSLSTTKSKRNLLAHGEVSFRDCGRNLTQPDLENDAIGLLRCLRNFTRTVDRYLGERRYVKAQP